MNALAGKPLRYLIGASFDALGSGRDNTITEVPWDCASVLLHGITIGYCNLLDELNEGRFPPYQHQTGTAAQYKEGLIDPNGPGFERNVIEQLDKRKLYGFEYVELDNPDSYPLRANLRAIALAEERSLKAIAKNPGLGCTDLDADQIVAHPNIYGIIVEKGAGTPVSMDTMRRINDKPDLPVWFVYWGGGMRAAKHTALAAQHFVNMRVTWSRHEYDTSTEVKP